MSELAAKKTPITPADLKAALSAAWLTKFGTQPPTNAIAVLMSQSALETGSWASCVCFNLAGIKSDGTSGSWAYSTTWENLSPAEVTRLANASTPQAPARQLSATKIVLEPRHPGSRFRAFTSLAEGVAFYLNFLYTHYAPAWPAVLDGDPFEFVHQLKAHGYFTADESSYVSGVCRMFDSYGTPALKDMSEIADALGSLGYDTTVVGKAVGCFQAASGLVVDNTAGPMTRAKLRVALAATPEPPLAA